MADASTDRSGADDAQGDCLVIALPTAAATRRLGRRLGEILQPGDALSLDGPLGAGKTCLVQGLARGLGVPANVAVSSPTFTLVNQYAVTPAPPTRAPGPIAGAARPFPFPFPLTLYHVDLYRLESARELDELGLWESVESGGILAVEWLSRFPQALPEDRLALQLNLLPEGGRSLSLRSGGPRSEQRLAELRRALPATKRRR